MCAFWSHEVGEITAVTSFVASFGFDLLGKFDLAWQVKWLMGSMSCEAKATV